MSAVRLDLSAWPAPEGIQFQCWRTATSDAVVGVVERAAPTADALGRSAMFPLLGTKLSGADGRWPRQLCNLTVLS
jgi:hypothetical protein